MRHRISQRVVQKLPYSLLLSNERFKMKRNEEQQYTLMYLSRLLRNHQNINDCINRSLVFTVQVNHLYKTINIQKAIYEKIHRALYGRLSSPDEFTMSMFIASDVEGTKKGYVPDEVLTNPLHPHYHGIIVFNEQDWNKINKNLPYWKGQIRKFISKIEEVKDDEIDEYGCIKSECIWIDVFDESKVTQKKHKNALGNYVQYAMKAYLQSCNRGILIHDPKVYPFDIYASDEDVEGANILFNDLWSQQQAHQASKSRHGSINLLKGDRDVRNHSNLKETISIQ